MLSVLSKVKQQTNQLSIKDIPMIRDRCISRYGFEWWNTVGLDELFEQLPIVIEEWNKQESLRLTTLKYYGVKNPK